MTLLHKNKYIIALLFLAAIAISGCAEINPFEMPGEVIRRPLGPASIKIGMSKEEVVSKWGEPDIVNKLAVENVIGGINEEWVYKAKRYTPIPIDAGYLNKTQYLYFDGNNLARISDEPR